MKEGDAIILKVAKIQHEVNVDSIYIHTTHIFPHCLFILCVVVDRVPSNE